jgi:DNA-binding NtrC family response regulator/tetratricopeptide (TPR) repeat protein
LPSDLARLAHGERDERRGATSARNASSFRTLDDLARARDASGFAIVRGTVEVIAAVAPHIERRARAVQRPVLSVRGSAQCDEAWRELAERLGVPRSTDPVAVASDIVTAAGDALLLVVDAAQSDWGNAVAAEIGRLASIAEHFAPLFVVLTSRAANTWARPVDDAQDGVCREIELDAAASPEDVRIWWEAVSQHAGVAGLDRLDALERWWAVARTATPDDRPASLQLGPEATLLFERLVLSRRGWPLAQIERLGPRTSLPELVAARLVDVDARAWVSAIADREVAATPDSARIVADALEDLWLEDPWAAVRAGELFVEAGEADRAEAAAVRALTGVTDATARADFWQRWEACLEAMPGVDVNRLLRAANLALRVGDVDRALSFARAAAVAEGSNAAFEVMLTLGRATAARGDLTTAAIALGKAMERAPDAALRARAEVEIAEVRYAQGDLEGAHRHATDALAAAGDAATQLLSRNMIGKLHLAAARWGDAEQHFAADACEAACAGDAVAELRARLNRAIALLSSGRRDEARSMLETVLEDGVARGELRAIAAAYSNLAAIATFCHEYPEALRLWEQAIDARRRVGEKIMLARTIANLAELRLRMGLVAEAEQALVFGRHACGPAIPDVRAAHFALVAARVHLARGRTLLAATEVASAIAGATGSSDGARLCDCYRLASRIALEDGDLARAEVAIGKARETATSAGPRADVALLHALRARAAGEVFTEQALEALELAREADDGELMREAHVLLHHAALIEGDLRAARIHLDSALALRNRIANSLTGELRERFLGRRELAELTRLEAAAGAQRIDRIGEPSVRAVSGLGGDTPHPGSDRPRPARSDRRMVGEDPALLALVAAIQKVGQSDATVLVHGESGTGKELVAEAIHEASGRRAGPMVKVNCAALVETLLLSELFGHEKGSFTGAAARRRGRFEMAEGGTIFLDEIGDISARTQVALLRVLQDRTFERVGGVTPIRANVRIVCATHRDLKAMVARGEFREDLYYRLRGVVLEVPALRNRVGDLPRIVEALLARIADERRTPPKQVAPRALEVLARHPWPGNVRELENALRAAALFAEEEVIQVEDFTSNVDGLRHLEASCAANASIPPPPPSLAPETVRMATIPPPSSLGFRSAGPDSAFGTRPASVPPGSMTPQPAPSANELSEASSATAVAYAHVRKGVSLHDIKRQIEEECIARALAECKGNITRAAALLGMKRPRLSQLVKQYGLGGASEDG